MTQLFHKLVFCLLLGGLCCFVMESCTNKTTNNQHITVSIAPLAFLVENIAGEKYTVETFVPRGSSPETYEPTPKQLMHLDKSALFFFVGNLGFEQTWLKQMQQNAPHTEFVPTSKGINLLHSNHSHNENDNKKETNECHGTDPHVWTTPNNLKIMAECIAHKLMNTFPKDSLMFAKNLQNLNDSLDAADRKIRTLLTPNSQKAFLIYHPTLSYFAHEYHLEQLTIEEDGKIPSPAHLQAIIKSARKQKVQTIFLQQEFDRRHAEIIAQETKTNITEINPLSPNCIEELIRIAKALNRIP